MHDMTYSTAISNVDALKRLGTTQVYLARNDPDIPWHIATKCEPGSMYRMGTYVDVQFSGEQDGITFIWYFDIEPFSASGSATYQINTEGCASVMSKLPPTVRKMFRARLAECAGKVEAHANEFVAVADRQFATARALRSVIEEYV